MQYDALSLATLQFKRQSFDGQVGFRGRGCSPPLTPSLAVNFYSLTFFFAWATGESSVGAQAPLSLSAEAPVRSSAWHHLYLVQRSKVYPKTCYWLCIFNTVPDTAVHLMSTGKKHCGPFPYLTFSVGTKCPDHFLGKFQNERMFSVF